MFPKFILRVRSTPNFDGVRAECHKRKVLGYERTYGESSKQWMEGNRAKRVCGEWG